MILTVPIVESFTTVFKGDHVRAHTVIKDEIASVRVFPGVQAGKERVLVLDQVGLTLVLVI